MIKFFDYHHLCKSWFTLLDIFPELSSRALHCCGSILRYFNLSTILTIESEGYVFARVWSLDCHPHIVATQQSAHVDTRLGILRNAFVKYYEKYL